jgi:hypothetical protein
MSTRGGVALLVLLASGWAAAAPKVPGKAAVQAALKAQGVKSPSVSHVYAVADRFLVLFTTKGRDCYTRDDVPGKPKECSDTMAPNVAAIARAADGKLTVEGTLALFTQEPPWDQAGASTKWGIVQVQDFDRDGTPELLVVYGYEGQSQPAVGSTAYRHLALVAPKPLRVTLRLDLDVRPQASVFGQVTSRFKFDSKKPEVVVTRVTSAKTSDDSGKREETTAVVTQRFVGGAWKVVDTRKGKPRVVDE